MRAVDTNVLVRLLTRDDQKQLTVAEEFVRPGAWVPHIALVEAVWVLDAVYSVSAERIANAVDMLLDHKDLAIQDADVVGSAVARFRSRPALGFSDCLMLEVCRKAGHLPLGTLDRALGKEDGAERL